ncbi:endonuclease VII domain-containing protein [Streptomyces sp. NBC_00687]|uniref:endonuclease VII domain-containing protein n=1 Tax=Streptomyces sp. NBC_00687 TaxID=2975807 RepID=UPI002256EC97|nr:endonuclease VII domain-containing protein [Streptomyces sp. NBC_00687]MCX4912876.1 endonuclease VII domain-containing protein [Streptomyces sp. NBC_00687]
MAIWKAKGSRGPMPKRPAPHKGPRCTTHHREAKKAMKAAVHESRAQKVYGLGPGDYDRLYALQGGRCPICLRATGKTRRLSIDHDHATGDVRGLLCRPCNTLLGHARDELEFFKRAYRYLKFPPARRLDDP